MKEKIRVCIVLLGNSSFSVCGRVKMVYAVIAILTVALHIHFICTQTVDVRCTEQFCKVGKSFIN